VDEPRTVSGDVDRACGDRGLPTPARMTRLHARCRGPQREARGAPPRGATPGQAGEGCLPQRMPRSPQEQPPQSISLPRMSRPARRGPGAQPDLRPLSARTTAGTHDAICEGAIFRCSDRVQHVDRHAPESPVPRLVLICSQARPVERLAFQRATVSGELTVKDERLLHMQLDHLQPGCGTFGNQKFAK
jgi:hypothetical protein